MAKWSTSPRSIHAATRIRSIRGNEIAMIFQEPMTSLSPVHTSASQIAEAVELHQSVGKQRGHGLRRVTCSAQVGIGNPKQRAQEYPHQFSGGMRQRAMIAMALSCNPSLLIADEPTTALDVTIQAQILELMQALQAEFRMAILMITHNLGVIAEMADRVAVMYMGKVVELADVKTIFDEPLHPYTIGLMRSIPRVGGKVNKRLATIPGSVPDPFSIPAGCSFLPRCPAPKRAACHGPEGRAAQPKSSRGPLGALHAVPMSVLLEVRDLKKHFPIQRGLLRRSSARSKPSTASVLSSMKAKHSASWANRAVARRPRATVCARCSPPKARCCCARRTRWST